LSLDEQDSLLADEALVARFRMTHAVRSRMADLTVRTRPGVDIPLAVIAVGLALLLAITARGALAPRESTVTPSPIASALPTQTAAAPVIAPAPPKEKKGHD
jgi:hypothetical protein